MRKIKYSFLALMSFTSIIEAKGLANLYEIDYVRADRTGKGYVKFKSDLVGTPASCTRSDFKKTLSFDTSTAGGKAIMSIALSAKAAGLRIRTYGTGNCSEYGIMESWDWGYVH